MEGVSLPTAGPFRSVPTQRQAEVALLHEMRASVIASWTMRLGSTVLRLSLAAFLRPEEKQGGFISAQNDLAYAPAGSCACELWIFGPERHPRRRQSRFIARGTERLLVITERRIVGSPVICYIHFIIRIPQETLKLFKGYRPSAISLSSTPIAAVDTRGQF